LIQLNGQNLPTYCIYLAACLLTFFSLWLLGRL
jgi:hypothetical protein